LAALAASPDPELVFGGGEQAATPTARVDAANNAAPRATKLCTVPPSYRTSAGPVLSTDPRTRSGNGLEEDHAWQATIKYQVSDFRMNM
jgi:hypothetical protein